MIHEKQNAQDLILFSQARAKKDAENHQRALMKQRHKKFNSLLQLVSRILFQNISEALISNKVKFATSFCVPKSKTHYEISICLDNNGKLDLDPKPEQHRQMFQTVFTAMESTILKNFFLSAYF